MLVMAERGPFMVVTLLISEVEEEEEISKNNSSGDPNTRHPKSKLICILDFLVSGILIMTQLTEENLSPWPKLF